MLFTYALEYPVPGAPDDNDVMYEEIDVEARSQAEADVIAKRIAEQDYMPGYRRIIKMQPGGSGGFVQIWSS